MSRLPFPVDAHTLTDTHAHTQWLCSIRFNYNLWILQVAGTQNKMAAGGSFLAPVRGKNIRQNQVRKNKINAKYEKQVWWSRHQKMKAM